MKQLFYRICCLSGFKILFLTSTFCYGQQQEELDFYGDPCIVVPDSLKIKNHGEAGIRFLYKKENNRIIYLRTYVYSYYDIKKREDISVEDNAKNKSLARQNTYMNPLWLEQAFYAYYARYPNLFSKTEADQLEMSRQEKMPLILFGFSARTCSRYKSWKKE
ncbi:MAG: hypothetical protein JNN12_02295 [Bacteroidetes Order II. Incertae sedis bacterium]|nr:hypothetical protein [Bacteroidetes Order II. bacterium]